MSTAMTLNPLQGTLEERVRAFQVISTAISASGMMSGWDTPAKVMSGCWRADALGVHPAMFMDGVHPMEFEGKNGQKKVAMSPRWEFEHALLSARLPGFDFEVVEETETACEIIFKADGRSDQRVRYTIEDAKRQGLYGRNANYQTSPKEMLWKQCWHRGGDRIGAHVLMGLSSALQEMGDTLAPSDPTPTVRDFATGQRVPVSVAEVVEDLVKPRPEMPTMSEGHTPPADVDWQVTFGTELRRVFGLPKSDKKGLLEKAGVVMTEVLGGKVEYTRADQIGQLNAKVGAEYLQKRYPVKSAGATEAARGTDAPPAAPLPAPPLAAEPGELDDADPGFEAALEGALSDAPPPVSAAPPLNPDFDGTFVGVCGAVRKSDVKDALIEHPGGSKKWWLVAHDVLKEMGHQSSLQLMDGDTPTQSPMEFERIARTVYKVYNIREAVDAPAPLPRHANRRAG
jgi:hypothetical protein